MSLTEPSYDDNASSTPALARQTLTLRIVVVALVMGVVTITGVLAMTRDGKPPAAQRPIPHFILIMIIGPEVAAAIFVPPVLDAAARRRITAAWPDSGEPTADQIEAARAGLTAFYQTRTIVRAALFEGAAFFSAITYMIDGDTWILALVALLALGVAANFPTAGRINGWIDAQLEKIAEERLVGNAGFRSGAPGRPAGKRA